MSVRYDLPLTLAKPAAAIICLALLSGCWGDASDRPEVVPVRGKVLYENKPVAGARVVFLNDRAPRAAAGETDEQGRYELTTFEPGDGAVPGEHSVLIAMPASTVEPLSPDDPQFAQKMCVSPCCLPRSCLADGPGARQ